MFATDPKGPHQELWQCGVKVSWDCHHCLLFLFSIISWHSGPHKPSFCSALWGSPTVSGWFWPMCLMCLVGKAMLGRTGKDSAAGCWWSPAQDIPASLKPSDPTQGCASRRCLWSVGAAAGSNARWALALDTIPPGEVEKINSVQDLGRWEFMVRDGSSDVLTRADCESWNHRVILAERDPYHGVQPLS